MALLCTAMLAGCGGSSAPKVRSLVIAPSNGDIYVSASVAGAVRGAARRSAGLARPAVSLPAVTASCGTLQYTATATYSDHKTKDESSAVTWSSSDTSVASISATGLATGVALGTTNIGATFMGVTATSEPLSVDQLNSITVTPTNMNIGLGATQQFLADGKFTFAAGNSGDLDVSSQVTWSSSNTSVATVDNTGNTTAKGVGSATITATSCDGGTVGQAVLTVGPQATTTLVITPATITISTGTTTLFTAMEMLSNGTIQAPTNPVTWVSDTTNVATIDVNSGVALGVTVGTSTVIATETVSGFTGTATLTVQAATARFAYVADAQGGAAFGGTISCYAVDAAAGTLNPFTPPFTAPVPCSFPAATPQQVLLHPSGDFMYYLDSAGFLHIKQIVSANGTLVDPNPNQAPVQASTSNTSTNVGVIDPTGRFIYVISNGDSTAVPPIPPSIYGFKIAQTPDKTDPTNGALSAVSPTFNPYTDATLNNPTWIMTDRAGKYVYVVNNGNDTISEYSIGADGTLSPLPTPTVATGSVPLFGTTDVHGHLYVANETPQSVSGYTIDTTSSSTAGQLKPIGSGPFPINNATFTINVITDPTGKYLYVLDSTGGPTPPSQVFAFNLNLDGSIGAEIGTPLLTGNSPNGMAIDPTGALLAIDNNFDNTISLFTIAGTGSTTPPPGGLTPAAPPTVATDNQPLFVVFYTAASGQ